MESELDCNISILSPVDQENFLHQLDYSDSSNFAILEPVGHSSQIVS